MDQETEAEMDDEDFYPRADHCDTEGVEFLLSRDQTMRPISKGKDSS